MQKKTHKQTLSPEAAKILEQYRNAGKHTPTAEGGEAGPDGAAAPPKPAPSAPPPAARIPRSGTRGK